MNICGLTRLLGAAVGAALLAGCGGLRSAEPGTSPAGALGATQRSGRAATSGDLLYATSTDHQYLYVMTYPRVRLIDTIGGFSPEALRGVCSDAGGNVYVVDFGSLPSHTESHVYVFQHGATIPSRVLSGPPGIENCAVDPVSGDLAVSTDNNYPTLAIYHNGSGSPTLYNGGPYVRGTYDDDGDLYLAAPIDDGGMPLAVFANGKFAHVSLDQRISWAANIQWYDGGLVFSTRARGRRQSVYRITFSSSTQGHVEPASTLRRNGKALPRFGVPDLVVGKDILATGQAHGQVYFWKYPKGGKPIRSVTEPIPSYFFGFAISHGT